MQNNRKRAFTVIDIHFEARLGNGESGKSDWFQIGQSGARFGELMADGGKFLNRLFRAKSHVYYTDDAKPGSAPDDFDEAPISAAAFHGMTHDFGSRLPDATGFCGGDQIEALVADVLDEFRNWYAGDDVNAIGQVSEDMFGVDYRKFSGFEYRLVWFGYADPCDLK